MPLGTEVGRGLGGIVLHWDLLPQKGAPQQLLSTYPRLRFMLNAWLHVRVINFRIIIIIITYLLRTIGYTRNHACEDVWL